MVSKKESHLYKLMNVRSKLMYIVQSLDSRRPVCDIHRETDVSVSTIHKIRWFRERKKLQRLIDNYDREIGRLTS